MFAEQPPEQALPNQPPQENIQPAQEDVGAALLRPRTQPPPEGRQCSEQKMLDHFAFTGVMSYTQT